eukprot:PhM_4_TR14838/c0_g1_i1/m.38011
MNKFVTAVLLLLAIVAVPALSSGNTTAPTTAPTSAPTPSPTPAGLVDAHYLELVVVNTTVWGADAQSAFATAINSTVNETFAGKLSFTYTANKTAVTETGKLTELPKGGLTVAQFYDALATQLLDAIKAKKGAISKYNITDVAVKTASEPSKKKNNNTLAPGTIAGIVIGVLVFVLILAYAFVRIQRNQKEETEAKYQQYNQAGGV